MFCDLTSTLLGGGGYAGPAIAPAGGNSYAGRK